MGQFSKWVGVSICSLALAFSVSSNAFAQDDVEENSGGKEVVEGEVSIFGSEKVGGGTWEYGTSTDGIFKKTKTVWSNYWHGSVVHGSSAQLGANTPNRSCVPADYQSKASQTSSNTDLTGYAYWNKDCSPVQMMSSELELDAE